MVAPTALAVTLEVAGIAALVFVATLRRTGRTGGDLLDVPERIQNTLASIGLPESVAHALAVEGAVFHYALVAWRSRPFAPTGARSFSYHRRNAYAATLYAVVGAALVEMAVVDLLVRSRHPTVANALFVIDALGLIWMLGFARSVQLRPILLTADSLLIRNGLVAAVEVLRAETTIEFGRVRAPAKGTPGYFRAALGQPNALVTVSRPVMVRRAYGKARLVRQIGLVLDDPKGFESAWRSIAVDQPEPAVDS
jgi:hypothetical protein